MIINTDLDRVILALLDLDDLFAVILTCREWSLSPSVPDWVALSLFC